MTLEFMFLYYNFWSLNVGLTNYKTCITDSKSEERLFVYLQTKQYRIKYIYMVLSKMLLKQ